VPTGLELEIMHVVWRRPSVTVRDVYEELLQQRKIAYTTVMTMMEFWNGRATSRRSGATRRTSTGPRTQEPVLRSW